jgi:hypothetical protein
MTKKAYITLLIAASIALGAFCMYAWQYVTSGDTVESHTLSSDRGLEIVADGEQNEVGGEVTSEDPQNIEAQNTSLEGDTSKDILIMLKDVGEPYLEHFGLRDSDFDDIYQHGVSIIGVNFDICASDEDVQYLLDQSERVGLRVVMPAGAGEAEWGYACDADIPSTQEPKWDADGVRKWVRTWKDHSAVYAWDISNEAGGNFPNADEGYRVSLEALQTAYLDVKKIDPEHPILIRMNGWFFYDFDEDFFREGNPYGPGVADIVMVNAYSNVEDYYDDFVSTVTTRAAESIKELSPDIEIIVSIGVWEEKPLWYLPSMDHVQHDVRDAKNSAPIAIAFYKYGAYDTEWWLPKHNSVLWKWLSESVK